MASVSITISDGLKAKIDEQWGDTAAWKDWVKAETRRTLVNERIRAVRAQADEDVQQAVAQIVAADTDG